MSPAQRFDCGASVKKARARLGVAASNSRGASTTCNPSLAYQSRQVGQRLFRSVKPSNARSETGR